MPSSYPGSLRFEQQLTGENLNTWGVKLDATLSRIDDSIAGYVAIAITGNYSLQSANDNTVADEARREHLKFTGALAANATITIPSVSKSYWMWNASGKVLTITTGSGSTITIDNGDITQVWCDGANVKTHIFGGLKLKDFIAASVLAATGSLPAVTGNAGKYVYTDGATSFWRQPSTADLSDYQTKVLGTQVALAFAASRRR